MGGELFIFRNPRFPPGLEQAGDENSSLLNQDRTTQPSLLIYRGFQDKLSLGSFYAFLPTQAPTLKQGEEIQR